MDEKFRALIQQAINQEELSHEFYGRLAKIAAHGDTRETLEYLAKEEMEHKHFLEKCLTQEGCPLAGEAHDVGLAQILETPAITAEMTPQEALAIAAKREEGSYHFYKNLAGLQPPGEIKDFLAYMSKVELGHKEKVEYLYDNAAFPEVW